MAKRKQQVPWPARPDEEPATAPQAYLAGAERFDPRMSTLPLIRSELLRQHGFRHAFTTRLGGVSRAPYDELNLGFGLGDDAKAVTENRRRLLQTLDLPQVYEVTQVHGDVVRRIVPGDLPPSVSQESGDALVALEPGIAVAVRMADCLPLLVADRRTGSVAAIHAGWRGVLAGVVVAGIRRLLTETASPASSLIVAIGPHIRRDAFEVEVELAARFAAAASDPQVVVAGDNAAKAHVDLAAVVRAQLRQCGVEVAQTDDVGGCTHSEPERFFSFRRQGSASGRHMALIAARPATC